MRCLIIIMNLLIILLQISWAQVDMRQPLFEGIPEFFYDLVNVASNNPDLSRLNLYIEIPYDELQFLKAEDQYKALYEVSVVIYDKDGDQIDGKIWQEEVIVDDFNLTNSRRHFSLTHADFHLKPNEYRISIGLMDMDTKKTGYRKNVFVLRDFVKRKFSVSDITFTDNMISDSLGIKSIHPQVSDYIKAAGMKFFCYFEIYNNTQLKKDYEISYQIRNVKNQIQQEHKYVRKNDGQRTLEYFQVDKTKLEHGRYSIEVLVREGKYTDATKKTFIIRWGGIPATISDLNKAIEQLKYIATHAEIDEIKNAPQEEKLQKFNQFWQKRDPSPGTPENELMNEYFNRIEYCNENFSIFREGWKTDMGMIYVIFGPPSDIERHPFEREYKPYEIWYYYHLNRQFIFIDETGFGEYRLRSPYWRDWHNGIYY